MKTIAMTMAFGLLAAPAFAQTSGGSSSDATEGQTDQSTQAGSSTSQMSAASQEKVREQLAEAGFQEVEILDASYLVRAQTEEGNTVLMVIDPPMGGMGSGGSSSGSGSTNGSTDGSAEED